MSFYKNIQSIKPHIVDKQEFIPVGELRLYNGINSRGEKLKLVYQCVDITNEDLFAFNTCRNCVMTKIDKFLHPDDYEYSRCRNNCKRCIALERSDNKEVTFVEYEFL